MHKLSICIPTYNRCMHLKVMLENFVDHVDKNNLQDDIEILISDNCSVDDTTAVVADFDRSYIFYSKNESNLGPDRNFHKLFTLAKGSYIWLPGDDDVFNDDIVSYLLTTINRHNFDYLFLRTSGPSWKIARDVEIVSNFELLSRATINTTFITSQVIRTNLIKPHLLEIKKYFDTYMLHYPLFLSALSDSKKCLISECVEIYPGKINNTGGYKFYTVFAVNVIDIFLKTKFANDVTLRKRFLRSNLNKILFPITYLSFCIKQNYNFMKEDPLIPLRKHYENPFTILFFKLYFKAPRPFVKVFNNFVKIAGKIDEYRNNSVK